jgi:hypothetical protein
MLEGESVGGGEKIEDRQPEGFVKTPYFLAGNRLAHVHVRRIEMDKLFGDGGPGIGR